jgi:hypothetical protein
MPIGNGSLSSLAEIMKWPTRGRLPKQAAYPCPPKAKVTRSNRVGRANQINDLCKIGLKCPKAKLTINSPTKGKYWRVIGGDSVTEKDTTWLDGLGERKSGVQAARPLLGVTTIDDALCFYWRRAA